jgi:nucleoside-diphosphate-sugar epimerase
MLTFPKRLIVLGSGGFIGRRICEVLSSRGDLRVKGLSSRDCDLLSAEKTQEALSDLTPDDALVMASAITRLRENSFNSMVKNIQMVGHVANVVAGCPVGQVIFLSTVDVYGVNIGRGVRISEKLQPKPNDYYAISKITGEFILEKVCAGMDVPLTVLRLSGIYGPGDNGKSAVGAFISSALKEKKICIYGGGRDMRDYVHVDDVCGAISASLAKRTNATLNVATGNSHSIMQIAEMIKSLVSGGLQIEFKQKLSGAEKRIEDMVFDVELLTRELPDLKLSDLRSGIALYLADLRRE